MPSCFRRRRRTVGDRSISNYSSAANAWERPSANGRFLYVGDEKLWVRGVTYGTFRPDAHGDEFQSRVGRARLRADGRQRLQRRSDVHRPAALAARRRAAARAPGHGRAALGAARRVPRRPLARARDRAARARRRAALRAATRPCSATPSATRSRRRSCAGTAAAPIERFLERLVRRGEGRGSGRARHLRELSRPPSTSSCRSSTSSCFNVYLESQERLEAYLARLQNLAGDRPLVMAEIGLDSRRNGEEAQARVARLAGPHRASRRAAPAPSSSPGPTSGTAAGTTSTTGTSA